MEHVLGTIFIDGKPLVRLSELDHATGKVGKSLDSDSVEVHGTLITSERGQLVYIPHNKSDKNKTSNKDDSHSESSGRGK